MPSACIAIQHVAAGLVEFAGEGLRLFGEVGRVADVRRQVAQFAGEGDAVGDGLALGQGDGVAAAHCDGGQLALAFGLVLLAKRGVVAVGGIAEGDDGLTDVPGRIAAERLGFADRERGAGGRAVLQRAGGIAGGLDVLRDAELAGIAQTDHQHPRGGHAGQIMQQRGLAGLAGDIAAFDQRRDASAAGGVERLSGHGQGLVRVRADDDAVAGEGGGVGGGAGMEGVFKGHRSGSVEAVGKRVGV
jgi:hypothetical protein